RTTSLLPGLRNKYPDARIHWLTLERAACLLEGNALIDEVFVCDGRTLPAALARVPHDLVICPDADLASVALTEGIAQTNGAKRLGFSLDHRGQVEPLSEAARTWYLMGVSDIRKKQNQKTYQDLVGGILELPVPILDRPMLALRDEETERAATWLRRNGLGIGSLVGINTGAGSRWPLKQWTLAGQLGLIERLHAAGHRALLLGGPDERVRHREIRERAPPGSCLDAGNDNSLRDFAARLNLCSVLVTGDTLALHIGTALGKQIVALFGPTSASEIQLFGRGAKVFTKDLDCLCCYSNCDRSPNCQDLISVDMVWGAVSRCLLG
ncbi:MAG: glycosyltransferase family 9 protein, partial [Planctomycetota bacterium]